MKSALRMTATSIFTGGPQAPCTLGMTAERSFHTNFTNVTLDNPPSGSGKFIAKNNWILLTLVVLI